jgi:hypothetical protein
VTFAAAAGADASGADQAVSPGRSSRPNTSVYQSLKDREGMVAAGMGDGVTGGFERLHELLAKMPVAVS